jgi:transcriptional regulator with XRE-family HTH domain
MHPKIKSTARYKLYRKGLTDEQIAQLCGVKRQAIATWRMTKGLPANNPKREPSVKQKLIFEVQKYTGQVNLAQVPIDDLRKILKALKKGG